MNNFEVEKENKHRILDNDGYIVDQNNPVFHSMFYGVKDVVYNGCELISVFNVLHFFGRDRSLSEIIDYAEHNRGLCFNGRFGTRPGFLPKYLRAFGGLNVKRLCGHGRKKLADAVDRQLSDKEAVIISVMGPLPVPRIHTFTVLRRNDSLVFLNAYHDHPVYCTKASDYLLKIPRSIVTVSFFVSC